MASFRSPSATQVARDAQLFTGGSGPRYPDPELLRHLFEDPSTARRVVKVLIQVTRTDLIEFERLSRRDDARSLALVLHRMLGGLGTLGGSPLLDHGCECLDALRIGKMAADDASLAQLRLRLHVLLDELEGSYVPVRPDSAAAVVPASPNLSQAAA